MRNTKITKKYVKKNVVRTLEVVPWVSAMLSATSTLHLHAADMKC